MIHQPTVTGREEEYRQHLHSWTGVLAAGIFVLFLGNWLRWGQWWMAGIMCALMFVFMWMVRDSEVPRDVRGDAVYYLGFLFTLTAFIATLVAIDRGMDGGDGVGFSAFLRNFGIAISTTIVGLALRVWLSMSEDSVGDVSRDATDALAEAVRRFKASLTEAQDKMDLVAARLGDTGKELTETTGTIAQMASSTAEISRTLQDQARDIAAVTGGLADKGSRLFEILGSASAAIERLQSAVAEVGDRAGTLGSGFDAAHGRLSELGDTLAKVTTSAEPASEAMDSVYLGVTQGAAEAAALAPALAGLRDSAAATGERLRDSGARIANNFGDVVTALDGAGVAASLQGVSRSMDELAARTNDAGIGVGTVTEGLADNGSRLFEILSSASAAIERLQNTVAEVGDRAGTLGGGFDGARGRLSKLGDALARVTTSAEPTSEAMKNIYRGVTQGAAEAAALAPALAGLRDSAAATGERLRDTGARIADNFGDVVTALDGAGVAASLQGVSRSMDELAVRTKEAGLGVESVGTRADGLVAGLQGLDHSANEAIRALANVSRSASFIGGQLLEGGETLALALGESVQTQRDSLAEWRKVSEDLTREMRRVVADLQAGAAGATVPLPHDGDRRAQSSQEAAARPKWRSRLRRRFSRGRGR